MTSLKLLGGLSACLFGLNIATATAATFLIDDFDVGTTSSVFDTTIPGAVTGPSTIDGSNTVMNQTSGWTWSRELTADLTGGSRIDTMVYANDQMGHVSLSAPDSNGSATYTYTGPAMDLSLYTGLVFDWGADLGGADVSIIFSDGTVSKTVASWSSLAGTGGSGVGDMVTQTVMSIAWGTLNANSITAIEFVVAGVPNLDAAIDNITAVVPIPAAVWLFGSSLMGIVVLGRRKIA